jgi:hypothetical protein
MTHPKINENRFPMKKFTTLFAIAPFAIFSQNVIYSNMAPTIQTNAGLPTMNNAGAYLHNGTPIVQTNTPAGLSNISLLANYRSNVIVNNTGNYSNGTQAVRTNIVRPNSNTTARVAQRSRPHTSTSTVAHRRPAPTQQQQAQIAQANKITPAPVTANPVAVVQNDNNFGENNFNADNNNINRGGNYPVVYNVGNNEIPVQVQTFTPVQEQQAKPAKTNEGNGSSFALPKINFPKMSFGGKSRSSSAHSAKKHSLKKFFIKLGRKNAARHHGKKKHFILDKCANWFK